MIRLWCLIPTVLFPVILACHWTAFAITPVSVTGTACDKLQNLTLSDVEISSAMGVAAGSFSISGSQTVATMPAFCRIQGVAHPTGDSHIGFEVWIPDDNSWNGKFQAIGVGGYSGSINYSGMIAALNRGYAVEGNDAGHQGGGLNFGEGHPERVIDWAYRAMHVSAKIGKLVVRDRTGRWPAHSYFVGCSSGGHQALSEAQRFPEDFDGIIAGDPAFDRLHQTAGFLYSWMVTHDANGAALLPLDKLQLVTRAVVAVCGDRDGVIQEPRACQFDPESLKCPNIDAGQCLTQDQVDAVKKVYMGARNPRTGEQIFPGWVRGSENFGPSVNQGWGGYIIQPKRPMRSEVYNYFLFDDPNWDFRTFDFDHDVAFGDAKIGYMSAVSTDLTKFHARGGKLLMYTGGIDPIVPPGDVARYYESVVKRMGGTEEVQTFFRFFMVPGMGHCGGGPGTTDFDMQTVLEQWVEHEVIPKAVIAAHIVNKSVVRTRPLCPYPKIAKWNGHGNPEDASSFICKANK